MYKQRSKILREIRKLVEDGKQEKYAARAVGITQKTLIVWSQSDERIARYRKALRARCRDKRTDMVEDAFFKKLIDGNGTAAEYIFFLCNNRPEEWRNEYNFNHRGNVIGSQKIQVFPNKVIVFSDLKNADDAEFKEDDTDDPDDLHAPESPEGNRIEGQI